MPVAIYLIMNRYQNSWGTGEMCRSPFCKKDPLHYTVWIKTTKSDGLISPQKSMFHAVDGKKALNMKKKIPHSCPQGAYSCRVRVRVGGKGHPNTNLHLRCPYPLK